eukprot:gene15232-20521_t
MNQLNVSTGFRLSVFETIIKLYENLKNDRKPALMKISETVNATVYPISFSIPANLILANIPSKSKPFGRVIPDIRETYFKSAIEETLYYEDMSRSLFSITFKKGGWDCLRINEILASGSLPLFIDIDSCPPFPLASHPKALYRLIKNWPGLEAKWHYYSKWGDIAITSLEVNRDIDIELYRTVVAALLQFTKNVLSTTSMAEYFLDTVSTHLLNGRAPQSILYLTHFDLDVAAGDYTTDALLHGLRTIFNSTQIIDYPCRQLIYRTSKHFNLTTEYYPGKDKLYGHGYTLGMTFDSWNYTCEHLSSGPSAEEEEQSLVIEQNIRNLAYDVVVLASGHRHGKKQDLIKAVCEVYPKHRVVVIDGADGELHPAQVAAFSSCAGLFFSREGPHPRFVV